MASVLDFEIGDLFILRVWKHHTDAPLVEWTNTYEAKALAAGGLILLTDLAAKAVAFEQVLHGEDIQFSRYTISTWQPDTHPYDPEAFYDHPLGSATFGTRVITGDQLPVRVCWAAQRAAVTGRMGKLYYRGCLGEGDVQAAGEGYQFTNPAAMETLINGAATTTQFGNYFAPAVGAMELSMIGLPKGVTVPQVRGVTDITSDGVVDVQMNHRWFNRA